MDLGLLQREAAELIGVALDTYRFWEGNATYPRPRHWPGTIRFLGYDPVPGGESFAEKLRAARRTRGLSQRELARVLGVDPSSVRDWELGVREPARRTGLRMKRRSS